MKGFGYFIPVRRVLVLHQKTYSIYRFWFGKCRRVQRNCPALDDQVLQSSSDVLVACPVQEVYTRAAPKLKYFDRPAFLYHTLRHQFKSDEWIASCWQSATSFVALKFSDVPPVNFDHFQGRMGALLGEITRHSIFDKGEGCLWAPTQSGHVYELYLKNNSLTFVRQIDQSTIANKLWRDAEIDAFKRYLERHFQANLQTLQIKWWGPNPPDDIDVYQTQWLEERLVDTYIGHINPALAFKHQLSARWFDHQHSLKKLKNFVYLLLFLGLPFFIKDGLNFWKIQNQHHDLVLSMEKLQQVHRSYEQMKDTDPQIKLYEEQKSILQTVGDLKKQMACPLLTLRHLSSFMKNQVRCHELLWLRGYITIDPTDHTLTHQFATYDDHPMSPQSFVLGITGFSLDNFQTLEKKLQTQLTKHQSLKIWTKPFTPEPSTIDSFQNLDLEDGSISGLLELTQHP